MFTIWYSEFKVTPDSESLVEQVETFRCLMNKIEEQ